MGQVVLGDILDVFVCYMLFCVGGEEKSEFYCFFIVQILNIVVDFIINFCQYFNVMIMGDFNDYFINNLIVKVLGVVVLKGEVQVKKLYNLMDGCKEGIYCY